MSIQVDRMSDGKPRCFTSVGCYPLFYVTHKGDVLCPPCAAEAEKGVVPRRDGRLPEFFQQVTTSATIKHGSK